MSDKLPEISQKKQKKHKKDKKDKTDKNESLYDDTTYRRNNETSFFSKPGFSPYAFVVDSAVKDNYSAYRLNDNMGIVGSVQQKSKRIGFNGEVYDMNQFGQVYNPDPYNYQQSGFASVRNLRLQPNSYNNVSMFNNKPGFSTPNYQANNQQPLPMSGYNINRGVSMEPMRTMPVVNYGSVLPPISNPLIKSSMVSRVPNLSLDFNRLQNSNVYGAPQSDRSNGLGLNQSHIRMQPINPFDNTMHQANQSGVRYNDERSIDYHGYQNVTFNVNYRPNLVSRVPSLHHFGDDLHLLKSVIDTKPGDETVIHPPLYSHRPVLDMSMVARNDTSRVERPPPQPEVPVESAANTLRDLTPKKSKSSKKANLTVDTGKEKSSPSISLHQKTPNIPQNSISPAARLRNILWTLVYPKLWMEYVEKRVETFRGKVINDVAHYTVRMTEVFQMQCIDALNSIYNEKNSLVLVSGEEKSTMGGGKTLNPKDIAKRSALLLTKLNGLVDGIEKICSEAVLPAPLMEFLGMLSGHKGIPPQLFFTEFELNRLQFSNLATLKDLSPETSKMVIGVFMLVRVLIYMLLVKPFENVKNLKKTTLLSKNLKTIGSVMYHIVMEPFRASVPIVKNNQAFLAPGKRIKAKLGGPFIAYEEEVDEEGGEKTNRKEEVVIGFYTKKKLQEFFVNNQEEIDKLGLKIEEWLEKMLLIINKVYNEKRRQ